MEPIVLASIIGAVGLVLVAVVGAIGSIILKRMTAVTDAQERAVERAALRDEKLSQIGKAVDVIKVEVDGKLAEILELNRDLKFIQGKEAGRLGEIAQQQQHLIQNGAPMLQETLATVLPEALAAAIPDALAATIPEALAKVIPTAIATAMPEVLPELIGKVIESKVVAIKAEPGEPDKAGG